MKRVKEETQASETAAAVHSAVMGKNGQQDTAKHEEGKTNALHSSKQLLQLLVNGLGISVFEYDIRQDHLFLAQPDAEGRYVQEVVTQFQDFAEDQQNLASVSHIPVQILLQGKNLQEKQDTIEFQTVTEDGMQRYRATYQTVEDELGGTEAVIGYSELLGTGEAAVSEEENEQCDQLTKLYNKETTAALVDERLQGLHRGEKGVLFLFNIDNFKKINERFGDVFGDGCLRSIASMVQADFRYIDILGRIGWDDFAIFIKGAISIDIVERRAQQILDLFLRIQVPDGGNLFCSIGIAVTSSSTMTYEKLAANAGSALREAKEKGGRRYRMYEG